MAFPGDESRAPLKQAGGIGRLSRDHAFPGDESRAPLKLDPDRWRAGGHDAFPGDESRAPLKLAVFGRIVERVRERPFPAMRAGPH